MEPSFVHVEFDYPESWETAEKDTIAPVTSEEISNEPPRFRSKLNFSFPSSKTSMLEEKKVPQLVGMDNIYENVMNAASVNQPQRAEANKPERCLLASAISDTALRSKFGEILKFLRCEGLINAVTSSPMPTCAKKTISLSPEMAEFYFLGQKKLYDAFHAQLKGPPQFADVESLKRSLSRSYADKPSSTNSVANDSHPDQLSVRNLFLLKFATKYTDYNVSTQWLSVLLKCPFGKKMDLLNNYIDTHGLRLTFEQYLETHLLHGTKPVSPYWLIECNADYLDFRMHKFLRMGWKPRDYRQRKAIWHKALDSLDKSPDVLGPENDSLSGCEIHACPGLIDMNMADSARGSSDPAALQQRWNMQSPLILALISEVSQYLKGLEITANAISDCQKKELTTALQQLIEMPYPTDDLSVMNYARTLIHLAEVFYRFWMQNLNYADECVSRETLRDAASNTEGAAENVEDIDNAEDATQTSLTFLPVSPLPVDPSILAPTLKRAHSSAVSKVNRMYCLSCLENTPNFVRIAGDNRILLADGMVVNAPEPSGCPLLWKPDIIEKTIIAQKEAAKSPDEPSKKFFSELPGVAPISRQAPLDDRFQLSGWLLPDEQSIPANTARENRACDEDSPDAPPEGCPIAFKVLDIQDSGELLVLEDKGSAADMATAHAGKMAMDYSAVVSHPLYETVRAPEGIRHH
ncbi:uncharacterized protein LOC129602565 isoform X2 [Paramacrobiotus metropolitanus]|uniref:uncharacterized protein LOC129602565 isoform X2 n=1 Tax=Paramacrobiotus metropolitanus TaxID=2943436 RepID=UPI002446184E|nr:uncharacterized protein LOC129602565 isoform X2 [Paramacrobiotus metropolitanus]